MAAAFAGFEQIRYLSDEAYVGLPRDTSWPGPGRQPAEIARAAEAWNSVPESRVELTVADRTRTPSLSRVPSPPSPVTTIVAASA